MVSGGMAASMLAPLIRTWASNSAIAAPNTDLPGMLRRIYRYNNENTITVQARNITYGAVNVIGGTGDGTIYRLTKDEEDYDIEACHMEAKTFECIRDQNTGATEHQEVFQIRGHSPSRDAIEYDAAGKGSGLETELAAVSSEQSKLQNPSFSTLSGSGLDKFTSWTIAGTATNVAQDTAVYFREAGPGDTSPASLDFLDNEKISQALSVGNYNMERNAPDLVQIAYHRENSCDGALTLRNGSNSIQLADITTKLNKTWYTRALARDTNLWPVNCGEDPFNLEIELSGRTTGNILVDDVVRTPMTPIDGLYYSIIGGATPFLLEKKFSFTDVLAAADSILQYWLWRAFGAYLPHTTGTPTIADP